MSSLQVGTVPVQSDGLNSGLSPVVHGDIALSIKINTQINTETIKFTNPLLMVHQRFWNSLPLHKTSSLPINILGSILI